MSKGDKERPMNRERYGETIERIFGKRCIKHRRANCETCFAGQTLPGEPARPFALGERVYVRELDVFGRITTRLPDGRLVVRCAPPMPGYEWTGYAINDALRPAAEME